MEKDLDNLVDQVDETFIVQEKKSMIQLRHEAEQYKREIDVENQKFFNLQNAEDIIELVRQNYGGKRK